MLKNYDVHQSMLHKMRGAGAPAPEGYASPCRARTSGSYRHNRKIAGGGAMRAFPHRKATPHRVAPAPPAAIDTTERLREEVRCGRSRTGRLRLTVSRPHLRQLSTQPKDCGRRCDAGVPAPEGYASPCRARTAKHKSCHALAFSSGLRNK